MLNKCIEIYELRHADFLSVPGLALEAASKKTKAELNYLIDIDKKLMVEKGIRGEISHSIYQYEGKLITKT